MPGHGKLNSDFNCLAGFNNRGKIPQGRQKSNTIKVLRTNILGKSQNDIRVTDVEQDIVSGGGLGDQQVGIEESVATEPGPLTAD